MPIPSEYRERVINDGIAFMSTITEAYGHETGMELWDTISSTLDPDVKGEIFFSMITGEYGGKITCRGIDSNIFFDTRNRASSGNKIPCIKLIRAAMGIGLKEAKDLCEDLTDRNQIIQIKCETGKRTEVVNQLRQLGVLC